MTVYFYLCFLQYLLEISALFICGTIYIKHTVGMLTDFGRAVAVALILWNIVFFLGITCL